MGPLMPQQIYRKMGPERGDARLAAIASLSVPQEAITASQPWLWERPDMSAALSALPRTNVKYVLCISKGKRGAFKFIVLGSRGNALICISCLGNCCTPARYREDNSSNKVNVCTKQPGRKEKA